MRTFVLLRLIISFTQLLGAAALVFLLIRLFPGDPAAAILGIDSVTHDLPKALEKPAAPGRVNAYVCRGVTCLDPVSRIEALRELLGPAGMK